MTTTETPWTVGIVADTTKGEVVLRMTEPQAADLLGRLTWLLGEDA